MDGIALTTWLLVQLAFDNRPSMNEGLRHSQDDIGFSGLGIPSPQNVADGAVFDPVGAAGVEHLNCNLRCTRPTGGEGSRIQVGAGGATSTDWW